MEAYVLEWLQAIFRFAHVVTAIAWIGASFYFVWLDMNLEPASQDLAAKGGDGELWAVHGGGFYNPQKYLVAPPTMPKKLHWFYIEAYSTWLTGFGLFAITYLYQAQVYLVDPSLMNLTGVQAGALAIGFMIAGLIAYEGIIKLCGERDRAVGLSLGVFVCGLSYLSCHVFSGRGAFVIVGASMATMMTTNVLFWIIPGQRKVVAALKKGNEVDPLYGRRGKQRSVHNTYFVLPVLFCMLSNHFAPMASHPSNWLVLILMMLAAVLVRLFFVSRHTEKTQWWLLMAAVMVVLGVFLWLKPPPKVAAATLAPVTDGEVRAVIEKRCYGCHALEPKLMPGLTPKGVAFESMDDINKHARSIYLQTVELKIMPLGNITKITHKERDLLARWYKQEHGG